ncbi:MAG: hypothetical protein AAF579_03220 [Cyanobacteria bacterium P01_C01_bin.118]
MKYIVTESQKKIIISALRFAAENGNARAAKDWTKLADYLEVLEAEKVVVNEASKAPSNA